MKGKLYLIPSPLGMNPIEEVIPSSILEKIKDLKYFVVEEIKTTRRFLSRAGLKGHIEELHFFELNEHTPIGKADEYIKLLIEGHDVGVISEAGLPAVADPGAALVAAAHRNDIEVIPMVGPSSLMLALMSSGMNGQRFAFLGYLPIKTEARRSRLKQIESRSRTEKESQIFIETPYRNDSMLKDILSVCNASTRICIAADITLPESYIKTKTVAEWKKTKIVIGKRPCVFILLAN